jgi:hypothetical protein
VDFVSGLNAGIYDCGAPPHSDWRIPNIRELYSLLDFSQIDPVPNESPFTDYRDLPMSSTRNPREPGLALFLYANGQIGQFSTVPEAEGAFHPVWIVRGPE